jgi:hypothetical protein
MANRIYLHVGRHKSGTTQIQRFLKKNRPLLAEQNIDYPLPLDDDEAHHAAAIYLYDLDTEARRREGKKKSRRYFDHQQRSISACSTERDSDASR